MENWMQTRKKMSHGCPPRRLIANKALQLPLFLSEHRVAKPVLTAEILRSPLANHRHCFFSTANQRARTKLKSHKISPFHFREIKFPQN